MSTMIPTNGLKAWLLASRPKTLTGAAAPVLVGGALGWNAMHDVACLVPFAMCLLFAFLMQIDANFVNDYFDFKKGTDREDRLGPMRACAQGWITPDAMKVGIAVCTVLSALVGLCILVWNMQWELLIVGAACIVGCFLYTTCLSYMGWGDVMVLVFFGIVPVGFTYYVMTGGEWSATTTIAGLSVGLVTDCLLLVNNYRDVDQDRVSGKRTVVVRFGKSFGRIAYLCCAIAGPVLAMYGVVRFPGLLVFPVLAWFLYKEMCHLAGRELNRLLGKTALYIFLFGSVLAALIVILA